MEVEEEVAPVAGDVEFGTSPVEEAEDVEFGTSPVAVEQAEDVEFGTPSDDDGDENQEEQDDEENDDEDQENAVDYPLPQFPISRVKKIMSICMKTNEEEDEADNDAPAKKGKDKKVKAGPMIITKEAAYLMALSTEYFVGKVGEMGGRITVSTKKKTMTLEHLKRALSDTEAFAFLEGCFQPSIIIGD